MKELQAMIENAGLAINVCLPDKIGAMPFVAETESTLEGNARLKARALKKIVPVDAWVLADDSGLFVDKLNGAPGVHSSRYGGEGATDEENRKKLLKALKGIAQEDRKARFICCFVLINGEGNEVVFLGSVRGIITELEEGEGGFGYDSLFVADGQSKTFAQLGPEVKNQISHRAHAIRQLMEWLLF